MWAWAKAMLLLSLHAPPAHSLSLAPLSCAESGALLTAADFDALYAHAARQILPRGLRCRQSSSPPFDREVFGDRGFEAAHSQDPVFQKIKLYLYFNNIDAFVPSAMLPQFARYARSFYLLYKNNLILKPDMSPSKGNVASLIEYRDAKKGILFKKPKERALLEAYRVVTAENAEIPSSSGASNSERLASAMLLLWTKIAADSTVCGMSPAENVALSVYMGNGFLGMNPYLRSGRAVPDKKLDEMEQLVNQALDKIADTEGFVFRSTTFLGQDDLPEAVYRQHRGGEFVTYDAFTSTSTVSLSRANLLIYSKTGKLLPKSGESEVLFRSHTRFRVLYNSCELSKLAVWRKCHIVMEEAPRTP